MNFLFTNKKIIIGLLICLALGLLNSFSVTINRRITESELYFYYQLRGSRNLSDDIVLIHIGDDDINALGGWPITRDYYSYAIHALRQSGAKTVGIDIIFSGPDRKYPDYDKMLTDFIRSSANICLPVYYSSLSQKYRDDDVFVGEDIHRSIRQIDQAATATGFSNLGLSPVVYSVPLIVKFGDSLTYSFGLELARLFLDVAKPVLAGNTIRLQNESRLTEIPLTSDGSLFLNHLGAVDHLRSISFISFLQTFRNNPEALNLADKLVVLANTVNGVAQIKSTPLTDALPASLLHVTVADNIIQENWLHQPAAYVIWILIVLALLLFLPQVQPNLLWIILIYPVIYIIVCLLMFIYADLITPLIYPLVSFGLIALVQILFDFKNRQDEIRAATHALDQQLSLREEQIEAARDKLQKLQDTLTRETSATEKALVQIKQQKSDIARMEKELADLRSYRLTRGPVEDHSLTDIIHSGKGKMKMVLDLVAKVGSDDIPVFITGETGTGKEIIARAIHIKSSRKNAPFVAINCGALPESLLESELFGHEKGSFTGAYTTRKGRFELADGGTVFLDEITETTPAFQTRLLRVLQEGLIERIGGEKVIRINVRIIAATNRDIQALLTQNLFRADLFYRLNGFPIELPPLRERKEDIPLLVKHFLTKFSYTNITGLSERAVEVLQSYHWPGNVRELENFVRRSAILAQSENRDLIRENDFPDELISNVATDTIIPTIHKPLEDQILELLRRLHFSHSAIVQTAKALGERDRGTITEYFRGICFQHLSEHQFNINQAAQSVAGTSEARVVKRVEQKISAYLENLYKYGQVELKEEVLLPPFHGLPRKYHPALVLVLQNLAKISRESS